MNYNVWGGATLKGPFPGWTYIKRVGILLIEVKKQYEKLSLNLQLTPLPAPSHHAL